MPLAVEVVNGTVCDAPVLEVPPDVLLPAEVLLLPLLVSEDDDEPVDFPVLPALLFPPPPPPFRRPKRSEFEVRVTNGTNIEQEIDPCE